MMTRYILLLIAASAILFTQCSAPTNSSAGIDTLKPSLRPSIIYDLDSVRLYLSSLSPQHDTLAAQEMKHAQEMLPLFPMKAVHHVKRSITYKPTAEAYIRLGELLSEMEKFSEASEAYTVALKAFPNDTRFDKRTYFNMLYTACMHPERNSLYPFIDHALESGLTADEIKKYLTEEPRLEAKRATKDFEYLLKYDIGLGMGSDSSSFALFLEAFSDEQYASLQYPTVIGTKQLTDNHSYLGAEEWWPFQAYIEETKYNSSIRFSPFKRLQDPAPGMTALIYSIDSSAYGARKDMWMIYYRLVTYTSDGKAIDNMVIAKHLGEEICTAEIVSVDKLVLSWYERRFKKPFNYKDMDNEVVSTEPRGDLFVEIKNTGEIVITNGTDAGEGATPGR